MTAPVDIAKIRIILDSPMLGDDWPGWAEGTIIALLDELEALRAESARYHNLRRAVNESGDCLPDCDDYAHSEHCPTANLSARLIEQQGEIEALRADLADAMEMLRDDQWSIDGVQCPECHGYRCAPGHFHDCKLGALLAKHAKENDK